MSLKANFSNIIKNYSVIAIIIFITASNFVGGYYLNQISNQLDEELSERNELRSRLTAIDEHYFEITTFETQQLVLIRDYILDAILLISKIHTKIEFNNTPTDIYSTSDYQVDINAVVLFLQKASIEAGYTTGYIFKLWFDSTQDNIILENRGFSYSVSYDSYIDRTTDGGEFVVELLINEYLIQLYSDWQNSILNDISSIYGELTGDSNFIDYRELGELVVYGLLRENYLIDLPKLSKLDLQIEIQTQKLRQLEYILSVTTIATILATYVGTRIENKENDHSSEIIRSEIRKTEAPEQKNDNVSLLFITIAFLLNAVGIVRIIAIVI